MLPPPILRYVFLATIDILDRLEISHVFFLC